MHNSMMLNKNEILKALDFKIKNAKLLDDIKIKERVRKELSWTTEIYGNGMGIRKYFNIPDELELDLCVSHGVSLDSKAIPEYEINKQKINFYFEKKRTKLYNKLKINKAYTVIPPALMFRRRMSIEIEEQRNGTIVFPFHSTHQIDLDFNRIKYIKSLIKLPKEFQPITVCLHWNDIEKKEHAEYLIYGINVVTAGHSLDKNFLSNFYNILKSYKYTSSNQYGSFVVYAIDLGIPFFHFGEIPKFTNIRDPYLNNSPIKKHKILHYLLKNFSIESLNNPNVCERQKDVISKIIKMSFTEEERTFFRNLLLNSSLKYHKNNRNIHA